MLGKSIQVIPNIKQHKYYCDVRWEDEITEVNIINDPLNFVCPMKAAPDSLQASPIGLLGRCIQGFCTEGWFVLKPA